MNESSEIDIRGSTEDEKMKRVFSTNLRAIMKQRDVSASKLAKELKISRQAVHKWIHGLALPRSGTLQQISQALMCDMSDLIKENGMFVDLEGQPDDGESLTDKLVNISIASQSIPIYDSVSCGRGSFIDEEPVDTLRLPQDWLNPSIEYFANMAEGDSMEPLIENGDYLVFERSDVVPSGMIGAFSLNGDYYCKRLKEYGDGSIWLFSDNDRYKPIEIQPDDEFRCLGKFAFKLLKASC